MNPPPEAFATFPEKVNILDAVKLIS